MGQTRRHVLTAVASVGVTALAGCIDGSIGGTESGRKNTTSNDTQTDPTAMPPTAEHQRYFAHDLETLRNGVVSGGVPKDGIPSIDTPTFAGATEVDLSNGDPVFGVVRNGAVKAYPQYILVHHEIVNDTIDGMPVAVTYCPLTGTVLAFERGKTEFGVSGRLVNSNLVMYDRATDSRWPQILGSAIDGPMKGSSLRELHTIWTTWSEWRTIHPETRVLTEETGHVRRYGDDPYGGYNPRAGYYASKETLFPSLVETDREPPKTVVIGARSTSEAIAFNKTTLLEQRVLTGETAHTAYLAVADRSLSTGYVYANPAEIDITPTDDEYRVEAETYAADELPLERVLAFDAMWFAWAGLYPQTKYVK